MALANAVDLLSEIELGLLGLGAVGLILGAVPTGQGCLYCFPAGTEQRIIRLRWLAGELWVVAALGLFALFRVPAPVGLGGFAAGLGGTLIAAYALRASRFLDGPRRSLSQSDQGVSAPSPWNSALCLLIAFSEGLLLASPFPMVAPWGVAFALGWLLLTSSYAALWNQLRSTGSMRLEASVQVRRLQLTVMVAAILLVAAAGLPEWGSRASWHAMDSRCMPLAAGTLLALVMARVCTARDRIVLALAFQSLVMAGVVCASFVAAVERGSITLGETKLPFEERALLGIIVFALTLLSWRLVQSRDSDHSTPDRG